MFSFDSVNLSWLLMILDRDVVFQLAVLQAEFKRIKTDNQFLKEMVDQVSTNYNTLRMHFVTLMKAQAQTSKNPEESGVMVDAKNNRSLIVPRQFMDLRLVTNGDADENPLSTLMEGRSRDSPGSPGKTAEVMAPEFLMSKSGNLKYEELALHQDKKEDGSKIGRGDHSPDHASQEWSPPNKVPRFNPTKDHVHHDQTEAATMRKARVSVRARSEAPMVGDI